MGMRLVSRSLLVCVLGVVCGGFSQAVGAVATESHGEKGAQGGSLLGAPLVVSSVDQFLLGGTEAQATREARRSNPVAAAARQASRTSFEGFSPGQAASEAKAAFPSLIEQPAGGPPQLPAGQHIVRYATDNAAQVSLPGGRRGVIESLEPIAVRASRGRHLPLDLSLVETGGGHFGPARSDVGIDVPMDLSRGVTLSDVGVSLTPVGGRGGGSPLSASGGRLNGATVLWRDGENGARDIATFVKATPEGFDLSTVLFSRRSPEVLFFRVGMPAGAGLRQSADGSVRIVRNGATLAIVSAPSAQDAEGADVPTSMSVHGRTLVVTISHRFGDYLYPIVVDPEVNDAQLATTSGGKRTNWEFHASSGHFSGSAVYEGVGKEHLETKGVAEYEATEWAYWGYQTKGVSKVYELKTETSAKNKNAKIESFLEFEEPGGARETKKILSTEGMEPEYEKKVSVLCAANSSKVEECLPAAGKEHNAVHFQQSATAPPGSNYKFSDTMSQGIVSISEPAGTHSTTSYNTTSPELEFEVQNGEKKETISRKNALYGAGSWLTKYAGALELVSKDPGIGVAATKLEYESSPAKWEQLSEHQYLEKENACQGVQCYEKHPEFWTLDPKLPDGEDKIRYKAEEAMSGTSSLESEGQATVKVDTKAPRVELEGLPWGNELSEKPYELTAEATDGEGTTIPASGVKSIALFIDGHEVGTPSGSCSVPKGACTASAKWTVNGAELGAGHHSIQVVAFDNAGNEGRLPGGGTEISIRHSTPVPLGPGSVDLQSGDFSLGASDVSLGSGLTVGRNYSSRALEQGEEGPLGPQWGLSLSSTESFVELVDGSMLMTAANGSQTIFAKTETTTYESPPGDSNLKLTLEENTEKQKLAYYLENAAAHTKVKFTLPSGGTKVWVPTLQEGSVATDTLIFSYQTAQTPQTYGEYALPEESGANGIAKGPDGALWFTDRGSSKIGKITTSGAITEYALPKESEPGSIAAGPDGNMWFTDSRTGKIGKITTAGAITEYSLPSSECGPGGIAAGPDGKMWFTEYYSGKIGKITTSSGEIKEYSLPEESGPVGIAQGPDGDMWYTNQRSKVPDSKIGKITTGGTITEYTLPEKSGPNQITAGPDGNLWFTEYISGKIGKITTSGAVTQSAVLPLNSEPAGITQGPDGNLWFTDLATGKAGKITTAMAITEYALPAGSNPRRITTGPDGKLWYTGGGKIGKITLPHTITEPTQALAPVPAGVSSCSPELKPGCRALKFKYATTTTATGEGSSQWGQYQSRLSEVTFDGYNPSSKTMQEIAVAGYLYDKQGRLRSEWDRRSSPARQTTYGYDEEGHITALTQPGQESWALTYGAVAGDAGTGRLLKAAQAPASTELWKGEQVANTEAPKVTGSAVEGVKMAVSNGKWTGSPIAYGYQWEDCSSSGVACSAIPGATNANYTPTAGDVGHAIVAVVAATNGDGSVGIPSKATPVVRAASAPLTEYALGTGIQAGGIAAGPDGNMWYTTQSKNKIGKITTAGTITEYAAPAGSYTSGIAAGPSDGNVWYTSVYTNKIGKITPSGTITEYALPAGSEPLGIVAGPDGNSWFTDCNSSKIGKITTSGSITEYALPVGSCPNTITAGPDGKLWFTEPGSNKIGEITTSGTITEYSVPHESFPGLGGIVAGSDGNLWYTEIETSKIGKITTSGTITEYALPAGSHPERIAAGPDGNLWYTDLFTNKVGEMTTSGTITEYALPVGSGPSAITTGPDGNVWFTNDNGKISKSKFTTAGESHTPSQGITVDYGVPLSGSGLPTMSSSEVAKWGQNDDPVEATAISPPDAAQGWPASSYTRAMVYYMDENGRAVNVARPSTSSYGSIATTEYNEYNDVVRTLSPDNRQTALEAGSKSVEVSKLLDTESTYNEPECRKETPQKEKEAAAFGTRLCETWGPQHMVKYTPNGFSERKDSLARNHIKYFYEDAEHGAPAGEKYDLVTETSDLALLANEEEVEVRKTTTSYSGQSNLGWELRAPTSVTADPEGKKITHTTLYNKATGQVTETRGPKGLGGESAHDERTIYYSSEANTEGFAACGGHPEWSGLVCETLPAKQPAGGVAPKLPVTTVTYNVWNEPLVVTETFGTTVRTKTKTYDAEGRLKTSETTSTANTALPKVTNEYNSATGALEKQSTTVEGATKTITSKYNTLAQLTEYTDADGNTAKYKYAGPENDGRLEEVTDGGSGGAAKQTYTYNSTTKVMEKLTDSSAGTFTAAYDAEGKLTSEVYPNGMCANDAYNSAGEATHLEYIKTTNCSEHEPAAWYSETRTPSVRGETFSRTSTLASESYTYDTLGRLTEAQETPAGEGCTTRLYAYDEESNRTSQTTRSPGGEGKCATSGGTTLEHSYDEGNRMTDTGIAYDSFANVTKLPAADAEGHELTSTFYVDGAVATQSQNGVTNSYHLDPTGRVRETISGANTTVAHYDGPGGAVVWTSESGGKSTRNIPGIDGALAATQSGGETPVIQLHDLQGDVVATIGDKTGETKLLSTYNSTEFGVPNAEKAPPKYAWLGAVDIASALSSGVITYGATSYVPQTGRALQSEQVEPPGLPGGSGAGAAYTMQEEPWNMQGAAREAAEAPGLEAAREQEAFEASLRVVDAGDPHRYMGLIEAERAGRGFSGVTEWGEFWDMALSWIPLMVSDPEDVPADVIADAVASAFLASAATDWAHKLGQKLEQCGGLSRHWWECRVSWNEDHIENPLTGGVLAEFPDFSKAPRVEKCWTFRGFGSQMEAWCESLGGERGRWWPYP